MKVLYLSPLLFFAFGAYALIVGAYVAGSVALLGAVALGRFARR